MANDAVVVRRADLPLMRHYTAWPPAHCCCPSARCTTTTTTRSRQSHNNNNLPTRPHSSSTGSVCEESLDSLGPERLLSASAKDMTGPGQPTKSGTWCAHPRGLHIPDGMYHAPDPNFSPYPGRCRADVADGTPAAGGLGGKTVSTGGLCGRGMVDAVVWWSVLATLREVRHCLYAHGLWLRQNDAASSNHRLACLFVVFCGLWHTSIHVLECEPRAMIHMAHMAPWPGMSRSWMTY